MIYHGRKICVGERTLRTDSGKHNAFGDNVGVMAKAEKAHASTELIIIQ